MTNSSLWEQENQEKLRDDYFYRCAHGIQNDYVLKTILNGICDSAEMTRLNAV